MARIVRHRWDLTPTEAVALQRELASRVRIAPLTNPVRLVAGSDASYSRADESIIAGWVVWDIDRREVVESVHVVRKCEFPYVPGLLSFREAPAILEAAEFLKCRPDIYMIDGQGLAHPRRMGLACHVGVLLDRPALGCAKSRLCGEFVEPARKRGSSRMLRHQGEVVGRVVRTRDGVNPLFVSVGHRITLTEAERLVLRCCTKYRLPEPTRLAHQYVTNCKRNLGIY
ncbi:MAG: endonuclease V [Phycisphaerales bacterium]|nr:endonuclease V [Phycisphaerales bacterium]MCB9864188.1 endonuclease V [Phycisphaerales bacterium]